MKLCFFLFFNIRRDDYFLFVYFEVYVSSNTDFHITDLSVFGGNIFCHETS